MPKARKGRGPPPQKVPITATPTSASSSQSFAGNTRLCISTSINATWRASSLQSPPKDTRTVRAAMTFCAMTVEVSGSSTRSFAPKSPARIQGECTPLWQESNGGCCSGGWGPPSHHIPAYTPKRRGSRGSPNYSFAAWQLHSSYLGLVPAIQAQSLQQQG